MKVLLSLLVSISFVFSAEILWYDDFTQAQQVAKTQNKPLILMLSSITCGTCNMMKDVVFINEKIIERHNKDYVSIILEIDFDDIPKDYKVDGTPTFYVFNKKGHLIDRKLGGSTIMGWNKFLDRMDKSW